MARASTIKTHPQLELIERDIAQGVPAVDIARRYGVSESALARHKKSRLDTYAAVLDDDTPAPTEVLGRLADLADSATRSRKLADASGTAAVRARAQATELSALNVLIDRLGIDDLDTVRTAQGAGLLAKALAELVAMHPETLSDAQRILRAQDEDFDEMADALARHLKDRKTR